MKDTKSIKAFMDGIEFGSILSPAWMIKIIIFEDFVRKVKAKQDSVLKQSDLCVGSKVHYQPDHLGAKFENGIVKEIPTHTIDAVRVVYNCNEEWSNYQNYTSALTNLTDLHLGWR